MRSLEMPQHDFDVGERCVYCLTDMRTWRDEQKTDEHIIPPAINGELIIRHGACLKCAELSNKGYENIALNNDLLFPRRILELRKSRNRGSKNEKPPKPLPPIAVGNHTMTPGVAVFDMAISKEQYPQAISLIMFPRAGFLAGADRTNGIRRCEFSYSILQEKGTR
jgi:hypothetical protein